MQSLCRSLTAALALISSASLSLAQQGNDAPASEPLVLWSWEAAAGDEEKWDNADGWTLELPEGSDFALALKSDSEFGWLKPPGGKPLAEISDAPLYFNARIRLESAGWFLLWLQVSPVGEQASQNYNMRITPDQAQGGWFIYSVPFSDFKIVGENKNLDPAPAENAGGNVGGAVRSFGITDHSQGLGMVCDRVWITQGGPITTAPATE